MLFITSRPLLLGNSISTSITTKLPKRRRTARKLRMAVPILPSDTAPDMLTFALEGPGFVAGGLFMALFLSYIGVNFEFGPRRNNVSKTTYILRINTDKQLVYDDGQRQVFAGERVISFRDIRSAYAASEEIERDAIRKGADLRVWISVMGGTGVKSERALFPKEINAEGGVWQNRQVQEGVSEAEKARFEYDAIESDDTIEREWAKVMDELPRLQIAKPGEGKCKLCGGTGTRRCARCGGVAGTRAGASFKCDCQNGLVPCDFCGGDGLPSS